MYAIVAYTLPYMRITFFVFVAQVRVALLSSSSGYYVNWHSVM